MSRKDPPKIDHPYVFSVSQVQAFRLCPRKWAYNKIDFIEDQAVHEILQHTQNRIYSMSLVHQELYQSGDLTEINFESYISSLASTLLMSYGMDDGRIALNLDVEDITLGVEIAIPLGLIVNELVSNAIKYAFPNDRRGEISIAFRREPGGRARLSVKDDGTGPDAEAMAGGTRSLGHQLVRDLTHQLDGELEVRTDGGTEFTIRFPVTK